MPKYKIKRGDTLESISKELNISVFDLKSYHNNHCKLSDLIGEKIPSHLTELIYIPVEIVVKQNLSKIRQNELFNLTLPQVREELIYGIQVSFFENEKENNLKYKISLKWLNTGLIKVNRYNLFINNEEPSLMVDGLACKVSSVLYPLELNINPLGSIVSIHNHKEIQNRWAELLPKLRNDYQGEIVEKYIQINEQVISDPHLLFQSIKKDAFMQVYFNGMYKTYSSEDIKEKIVTFPLIPSIKPVEYITETRIKSLEEDDEKYIQIDIKGELCDERTKSDFNNEADFPTLEPEEEDSIKAEGYYKARYFIDPVHNTIDSLYFECTLELEKTKKVYIVLSQLNKEEKNVKEKGIIEIGKRKENKKSFFFD